MCTRRSRRTALVVAVLVGVAGCSGKPTAEPVVASAPPPVPPAQKADPRELHGRWKLIGLERNGKALDVSTSHRTRGIRFDGDSMFLLNTETGAEADTYLTVTAYDPATNPKQFDVTSHAGPDIGKVTKCIYELNGDELVLMMSEPAKERPASFDTTRTAGVGKQTFRRLAK